MASLAEAALRIGAEHRLVAGGSAEVRPARRIDEDLGLDADLPATVGLHQDGVDVLPGGLDGGKRCVSHDAAVAGLPEHLGDHAIERVGLEAHTSLILSGEAMG